MMPTERTGTVSRGTKQIGLALSGGGIRAAVFHLGVLKWLAEREMLEQVGHISSVSGASLCIGLIYTVNGYSWPKSEAFLHRVLPEIRELLLTQDIQTMGILRLILEPWNLDRRVNVLAELIKERWGIRGSLEDLPKFPQWTINCTTFETGKDFRFSQSFMGDYKVGYVKNPDFPIAEAVAASAGFPVLIGPYRLNTKKYHWNEPLPRSHPGAPGAGPITVVPALDTLHLWDGGVYDNLGLEALYKPEGCGHLTGRLNYLIVSNASSLSGCRKRRAVLSASNLRRLLDINRDQVASLRSRDVLDYFSRTGKGFYVKIGTPAQRIAQAAALTGVRTIGGSPFGTGDPFGAGDTPNHFRDTGEFLEATGLSAGTVRAASLGGRRASAGLSSPATIDALIAGCLSPASAAYAKNYPTVLSAPSAHDYDLLLRHGYETAKCTTLCFGLGE